MTFIRRFMDVLCIMFGVAMGKLWQTDHHAVIVYGICFAIFVFVFYACLYIYENKADYSGRHR